MRGVLAAALAVLVPAACTRPAPSPAGHARYTVGASYQAAGAWHYPRETPSYDATGLAVVQQPRSARLTADGERYDPAAMAGAHATLPLPSVARVTALDTGRQVLVRLNDRGPDEPGRLIALAPAAAALLGIAPGGVARVRVQLEVGPSEALRDALSAGPKRAAATAGASPGVVTAEALPPPGSSEPRGPAHLVGANRTATDAPTPPDNLPATVVQVPPLPGALWLDLGEFHESSYARQRSARLAALRPSVEREGTGRSSLYRVRAGPFATVREADNAMDQARRAGVFDATITAQRDQGP